jgi:hypothetical protein
MKPRRVEAKVLIKEDTFHRPATTRLETAELALIHSSASQCPIRILISYLVNFCAHRSQGRGEVRLGGDIQVLLLLTQTFICLYSFSA